MDRVLLSTTNLYTLIHNKSCLQNIAGQKGETMPVTPDLIVFGVQSVIKLGLAAEAAYEQYVRDRNASLPLLPATEDEGLLAQQFFKQREMRHWVEQGGPLAAHWNQADDLPQQGPDHLAAVIAQWHALLPQSPMSLPRAAALAGVLQVRQWDDSDPDRPPSPQLRIILALADTALDFARSSPTLFAATGASQPLLRAIAALAVETRGVIPPLDEPDAWKDEKWLGANFGQSLLLTTFRAGLATLARHPDLVVNEKHVQRLVAATILPLKQGFDSEANRPGATSADVFSALTRWETLRDQLLPGMAAAALRSVAADRNAFLGNLVHAGDGDQLTTVVAALSGGVLDQAASLTGDDLLQRQTWLGFWRAGVTVIASRPELLVSGTTADEKTKALRQLVAAVAGKVGEDAQVGRLGQVMLLDVATATLDSVRTALPMLLGSGGTWDGIAAELIASAIDGIRPALAGDSPALLRRLASRDQIAAFTGIVLSEIAATPRLVTGGHAGTEAQAVISAVTSAMAEKGADLLSPQGWLAVAAAAAKAAAANPGRLFGMTTAGDARIGTQLIQLALSQASDAFDRAASGGQPPVLTGPSLQQIIVTLLQRAASRPIGGAKVAMIGTLLATLVAEAQGANGQGAEARVMPSQVEVLFALSVTALLDGRITADAPIGQLLRLADARNG